MRKYFPDQKMESQIKGKFAPRRQKSKKEEAEFGKAKRDILVCKKCQIVYWQKSWHHKLAQSPKLKAQNFTICPACQIILNKKYEGEIILENVPEEIKKDIKTLAKNFGQRAFENDPLDRIISIEEEKLKRPTSQRKREEISRKEFLGKTDIRILTTENQLAKRLAKKINEAFGKKHKPSISSSHQEDITRIKIRF